MTTGGFGGWIAVYVLSYSLFFPALNILVAPVLFIGVYTRQFKEVVWRKYLIINGGISIFGAWFVFLIPADWMMKIKYEVPLYRHIFSYAVTIGIALQAVCFVMWLVFSLRKRTLPNSYYKAWGIGFMLLYLLPGAIDFFIANFWLSIKN